MSNGLNGRQVNFKCFSSDCHWEVNVDMGDVTENLPRGVSQVAFRVYEGNDRECIVKVTLCPDCTRKVCKNFRIEPMPKILTEVIPESAA